MQKSTIVLFIWACICLIISSTFFIREKYLENEYTSDDYIIDMPYNDDK